MQTPKWINSRYEIIASLGSGGSSNVFKAIDRKDKSERTVAAKLLGRLPDRDQDLQKEFFAREVRALSSLSHARIVRLLDYGFDEDNNILYLILEHVERAESLRDRVPKWEPGLLASIDFVIELLDAISYAHESHVIHRDLNPGNILIDGNGNAKIIDFGISKVLGTLNIGRTVGDFFTRPYASPEQIAQQEVGYSADLYALAAVLYFMITRRDPETVWPLSVQFAKLVELPEEIQEAIQHLSAVVVADRYATAQEAMRALKAARQNLEVRAQTLHILLTTKVIKNLYDQTVIGAQNSSEAKAVVQASLDSGAFLSVKNDGQDYYDLVGDSLILTCSLEKSHLSGEYSHFVAKSVHARMSPHALEGIKQHGYRIYATWKVGSVGDPISADKTNLAGFLDEVDKFFRNTAIEQKRRERRADLIETWQNLLYLDRDLKQISLRQFDYINWVSEENNTVIKAQLAHELVLDELLSQGQLLAMSTKRNLLTPVGHYIRQDGNHVVISKRRGFSLQILASAGKLTIDQQQWAAAWNRQRLALEAVLDERCVNSHLPDVLLDPSQAENVTKEPIPQYFNHDFDDDKKGIVQSALSATDIYLIQGPPGTGKTRVISEIVAQILTRSPKARILLVSQSNVAVDNVLMTVGSLLPNIRMARIGREELIAHGAEEYLVDRRLADWAQQVHEKSNQYLLANSSKSEEQKELESYLDLIEELRANLDTGQSKKSETRAQDVTVGVELLRDRFPAEAIEPTVRSLSSVSEMIKKKVYAGKSNTEKVIEEWLKRITTLEDMEDAYLQACSVLAGTCVGVVGKKNLPERFDWVIVDEAGRATPSEILIPLVRGERSILVGDHKQLPPVVEHELSREASKRADIDQFWLRRSLFEYLFERLSADHKSILRMQYRMHPHIANLISRVFYREENLESGVSLEERAHGWNRWPNAVVWYSTSQLDNRFEETNDAKSKFNLCEANIILTQLTELDKDLTIRGKHKTVAVIAGYTAQMELLSQQLETQDKSRWKAIDIEINTVDAFQGREEDIVFYSVVRSNPKREIGFLDDSKRLNVALSRARELLFVVGDHRMVASANTRDELNPFKDVIAHFLAHPAECLLVEASNDNR